MSVSDMPQDSQHLISASIQLHIMLRNGNETVGTDGSTDLYSDSILSCTPEVLDVEVLLELLEEQLYLPTVLVEKCYQLSEIVIVLIHMYIILASKTQSQVRCLKIFYN